MAQNFDFDATVLRAEHSTQLSISDVQLGFLPEYDVLSRETYLCAAYWAVVKDTSKSHTHVVVVAYRKEDGNNKFRITCADRYLEGKLESDSVQSRISGALETVSVDKVDQVQRSLEEAFNLLPESAHCTFWEKWRANQELCAHTSHFLAYLRDNKPDFKSSLQSFYESAYSVQQDALTKDGIVQIQHLAFRVPILLEGDRGAGKTLESRAFARKHDYPVVEVGGHEGIESVDLLGCLVPYAGNQVVWKDGPLSEAFRLAQTQKTVLIIDELLRIPTRQLSILLTPLSPDEGRYKLRTGRILSVEDGVAKEEVLTCPIENLAVIATTNVGSEYAVDDCDPALAERFIILRMDTTEEKLKHVLTEFVNRNKMQEKLVAQCVLFFNQCKALGWQGQLARTPTTRTMVRLLELVKLGAMPWMAVQTLSLLWVSRGADGMPNGEQQKILEKLAKETFK